MAATPSVFILIFYFCLLHLKWLLHIYFPNWFTHSKEGSMGRLKNEQNIWLCCFNYRDKQRYSYMNSSDPGQCHLPLIFVLSYLGWGRQGQAARLWVLCKHGPLSEILSNDKLIKRRSWDGWGRFIAGSGINPKTRDRKVLKGWTWSFCPSFYYKTHVIFRMFHILRVKWARSLSN